MEAPLAGPRGEVGTGMEEGWEWGRLGGKANTGKGRMKK